MPVSALREERYGDAAAPAITFSSSIVTQTLGGPAHLLLSIMGWCLRILEGGESYQRPLQLCPGQINLLQSVVGWINHFCYITLPRFSCPSDGAIYSLFQTHARIQFSSLWCQHPKRYILSLGIAIQVSIFILTIHIFLFYSLFYNILASHVLCQC